MSTVFTVPVGKPTLHVHPESGCPDVRRRALDSNPSQMHGALTHLSKRCGSVDARMFYSHFMRGLVLSVHLRRLGIPKHWGPTHGLSAPQPGGCKGT